MKRIITFFLLSATVALSGCATWVTTDVSIYHEWPSSISDTSYIVERGPAQENDLVHKTFENTLREQLNAHGFNEAKSVTAAKLKISLLTNTTQSRVWYPPNYQLSLYDPFWQLHFNRHRLYRGYYPYYGNPYFASPYGNPYLMRNEVYPMFLHQLQITIAEEKSGKKLADLKASSEQFDSDIAEYVPYLIESAMKNFPGKNGASYQISLKKPQ